MLIRQLYLSLSVVLLSSCALIIDPLENNLPPIQKIEKPTIGSLLVPGLANIKADNKIKPVVAIYTGSFTDQTGQRRSNSSYATFSSAVASNPCDISDDAVQNRRSSWDMLANLKSW